MREFFIKTKNEVGTTNLYTRIRKRHPSVDINVNTLIKVDIETFRGIEEEKRNGNKVALQAWLKESPKRKALEKTLNDLDTALTALASTCNYDADLIREKVDDTVMSVVFPKEYKAEKERQQEEEAKRMAQEEALRMAKEREEKERAAQEEAAKADVIAVLDDFIAKIKTGEQKHKRGDYSSNTVKVWNSFRGILKEYMKKRSFTWNDINKKRCNQFTAWMQKGGYMPTSINKYLICFKALVRYAYDEHIHSSEEACKAFTKVKFTENDKANEIYLTADEIQALYDMKLTGTLEIYRDVFLIGCYTCQRFSDYSAIEKDNIYTTANGTRVVKLIQKKTKNTVFVPILDDKLETLLAKYDYNVPDVCDVVMNRYIKEILKDLSQSVTSLATELKTQLTMKERAKEECGEVTFRRDSKGNVMRPRYDMVSTHTARRTGITLLYKSGLFDIVQLMHVSGHKDTKTFLAYIKLSGEEIAEQIAEAMKKSQKNPFA